ncbi:hypothetical protein ACLSZC_02435 [Avibacterium avium]|uniref:hypothetical protein n=1 Tax=Avibacterium avium TaxID=751 RepID=UPI003BF7D54D
MRLAITYNEVSRALNDWAAREFLSKNVKYNSSANEFIQYLNYYHKLVVSTPRRVSFSTKFNVSPENEKGFEELKEKFEVGEDVNPYLSKLTRKADYVDDLFDTYGIKHFHLGEASSAKESDNIPRTDELALAFITDTEVFFILSKKHSDETWYSNESLDILHNERPDLIKHFKVTDMMNITPQISQMEDLKWCRKNNASIIVEVSDGTAYLASSLGSTLSGYSIMHCDVFSHLCITIVHHVNSRIIPSLNYIIHNISIRIIEYVPNKEIAIYLKAQIIGCNGLICEKIYEFTLS